MKTLKLFLILAVFAMIVSCGNTKTQQSPSQSDNDAIQKYLDEKMMQPGFGGTVFSAYEILKKTDDKIFLWAYLQEYYKKDNKLQQGSGWSVPVALSVENTTDGLKINNHEVPHDGESYANDIKRIFPDDIQQKIFNYSGSSAIQKLEKDSKDRAEKYFK